MSAYFITSTGTGVGKTFATCALLYAARARGQVVHGYKPIISGWDEGSATDTAQIIEASGGAASAPAGAAEGCCLRIRSIILSGGTLIIILNHLSNLD